MSGPCRRTHVQTVVSSIVLAGSLSACISLSDAISSVDLCKGLGPVATVRVNPAQLSLRAGDSAQVTVDQFDARGQNRILCTDTTTWSSGSTAVASVRGEYLWAWIRGVSPGQTSISATASNHVGTTSVTVTPP